MEKLSTATNNVGDVATYLFHDGKHHLHVFDHTDNVSTVHTLTFVMDLDIFTYLAISSDGMGGSAVFDLDQGMAIVEGWQDVQNFVNTLEGAE